MLRERSCLGVERDIAENASATDTLEPAAARPMKAFWATAALDFWPATARTAGAAMDMVMVAIFFVFRGVRKGAKRVRYLLASRNEGDSAEERGRVLYAMTSLSRSARG